MNISELIKEISLNKNEIKDINEFIVKENLNNVKNINKLIQGLIEVGKDDDVALDSLKSFLDTNEEPLVRLNIAAILMRKGKYTDAIEQLQFIIKNTPHEFRPNLMLGECYFKSGNISLAKQFNQLALGLNDSDPEANYIQGTLHEMRGQHDLASEFFGIALKHRANDARYAAKYMGSLCSIGDPFGALGVYSRFKKNFPSLINSDILTAGGIAYASAGEFPEARECYLKALAQNEKHKGAQQGLLATLSDMRKSAEFFKYADLFSVDLKNDPSYQSVLGYMHLSLGDVDKGMPHFRRSQEICIQNPIVDNALQFPIPEHRIRHDYEQLKFLKEKGILKETSFKHLDILEKYKNKCEEEGLKSLHKETNNEFQILIEALCSYHFLPQTDIKGSALGFYDQRKRLQKEYEKADLKMVVIDNFLSKEALAAVREYCLKANVFKRSYANGYSGAFLQTGFICPALLKVAEELRNVLPELLADHPLRQAWAFKYDQRLTGISTHADFAAVNVNFWIAPEDANLEKSNGGMVIYDIPAPKTWSFVDYNADTEKIHAFLTAHGAKAVRVPHKENRCVIFDSSLFHTTDEIHFAPGYENRRVNVTLLYGQGLRTR